jgi:hypothetical protein
LGDALGNSVSKFEMGFDPSDCLKPRDPFKSEVPKVLVFPCGSASFDEVLEAVVDIPAVGVNV